MPIAPFVTVDVGNSRIKVGLFAAGTRGGELPEPLQAIELPAETFDTQALGVWLSEATRRVSATPAWWIASVNREPTERLIDWLKEQGGVEFHPGESNQARSSDSSSRGGKFCQLQHSDLPLTVALSEPERVGIDRLLGAVAANHLRTVNRRAIVIDVGSAITVDLVSRQGEFLGGAILPGIGMAAKAMHDFTDLLPLLPIDELTDPPKALGTSTIAAMQSGLCWGAVGAMKELIARLTAADDSPVAARDDVDVFLTGGAAPTVARFLDARAKFVPHLVLGGIALVARR